MTRTALLLCIGNELRGDDGAGAVLGRKMDALSMEGVRVESAMQLFPEHAELAGQSDVCVLVDASLDTETVLLRRSEATEQAQGELHSMSFASLLSLCETLYGQQPEAWVCEIPAADFGYGTRLGERCEAAVDEAFRQLADFLQKALESTR
jgi:hydrogenase maturation protease